MADRLTMAGGNANLNGRHQGFVPSFYNSHRPHHPHQPDHPHAQQRTHHSAADDSMKNGVSNHGSDMNGNNGAGVNAALSLSHASSVDSNANHDNHATAHKTLSVHTSLLAASSVAYHVSSHDSIPAPSDSSKSSLASHRFSASDPVTKDGYGTIVNGTRDSDANAGLTVTRNDFHLPSSYPPHARHPHLSHNQSLRVSDSRQEKSPVNAVEANGKLRMHSHDLTVRL